VTSNARRAVEYVRHGWPIAAVSQLREDGTAELAGPVTTRTANAAQLWGEFPSFGIALYCAELFAILELPARLGAPLHHRLAASCPTLHLPHQGNVWRFVVRPHPDLADPNLLGRHGRLYQGNVFVPIAPVPAASWWRRRADWLIRPAETLWEPGDPAHVVVNLKRLHTATSPPADRRAAAVVAGTVLAAAGRPS
jgi:hypothetical protein